jgi:Domain of unknown function (DUF4386)
MVRPVVERSRELGTAGIYAWLAGIVFVLAVVAESVVGTGFGVTQSDSAPKIAEALYEHRTRVQVIAAISVVFAPAFVVYLNGLYHLLREDEGPLGTLGTMVLVGGVLFITLHAVSDIGITGMLGAKLGRFGAQRDPGISYALYLTTYAVDSVSDVFGSLFALAAGLLALRSGVLPRWLGRLAILVAALLFLQGFGLGGLIATYGLVLDLIGFVLLLVFVLASSIVLLRAARPA